MALRPDPTAPECVPALPGKGKCIMSDDDKKPIDPVDPQNGDLGDSDGEDESGGHAPTPPKKPGQ